MYRARDNNGNIVCAHCGRQVRLTKDHVIPRGLGLHIDGESNIVGLCKECNRDKANYIVEPGYYRFLNNKQIKKIETSYKNIINRNIHGKFSNKAIEYLNQL